MAVEDVSPEFGEVSRLKGAVFEYVSLGASVVGLVALAVLLVYVVIDAFDLTRASPAWLFTYIITLVAPFVAYCLYSAGDLGLARRVILVLTGGLVVTFVGFTGIELVGRPIPRLTWELTYLFVIVVPVTAYSAFAATTGRIGQVGFGLVGRLVGGTALALGVIILFLVFDVRLWFLAYSLGILPAGLAFGYSKFRPSSVASVLVIPLGVGGIVLAILLRSVIRLYPITPLIFLWTLAIPITLAGILQVRSAQWKTCLWVGGLPLTLAIAGSATAEFVGLPPAPVLIVLVTAGVPTTVYVHRVIAIGEGITGLVLPVVLVVGVGIGTLVITTFGMPSPDPWLDISYLTSPPSRNPTAVGLYPAIVGSIIIIALVAGLSFALGVGTAVFLEEYTAKTGVTGAITRLIQVNIANLAAVPSVVYGLLGLGLFANLLGLGFGTAVTAALTLSLLILPITIIAAQEAIRAVPDDLRRGSDAMGATRWQTTKNVVLPEALPGILTGTILALGRAIGETAPLIMIGAATTVFSAPNSIWSKLTAMPMQIFAWADFPQPEFRYGVVAAGVVTLLLVLLSMNAAAIIIRNRAERGP